MQARYYDPVIGRFYSNDPIGFRDVHSFNRYQYVANNPYKYTDPDGQIRRQLFRFLKDPVRSFKNVYRGARRELRERDIIDTRAPKEGSPIYREGDVPVIIGHSDGKGGIVPLTSEGEAENTDSNNQFAKRNKKEKNKNKPNKGKTQRGGKNVQGDDPEESKAEQKTSGKRRNRATKDDQLKPKQD